ncbi:MAG: hypothetical protein JWQ57_173 [Mucilaginibacter sp.]|nr:hypothetical protein [Mucilaginibacter sp.]
MKAKFLLFFVLLIFSMSKASLAQNLPSLVTSRNINSTFSIVGYDPQAKEWGTAVATNNIYVGNSTCYVEPGVGVFSVIAETEPQYGLNGIEQLKFGRTIEQAIRFTQQKDSLADYRQVSGVDAQGNVYAFTGSSLRYWKGVSTHLTGKYYAVMGNQLAPATLKMMAAVFEHTKGTLAERLLKSLLAGEEAGGQISGKQSAALVVKGLDKEWFNQIDLRVDHSRNPFEDLERLLNYHYGRITINQAIYAVNMNNRKRGEQLLQKAALQTVGWYGIYPKIAKAWLLLNNEQKAIGLIKAAVKAEPKWKENVPVFYCLYHHPSIRALYPEKEFTVIDWNNAISMFIDLNKTSEAVNLVKKVIQKNPSSSYTWYLLAKANQQRGDTQAAQQADVSALKFDPENADAKRLLKEITPVY